MLQSSDGCVGTVIAFNLCAASDSLLRNPSEGYTLASTLFRLPNIYARSR